jgi:hypothetical protein
MKATARPGTVPAEATRTLPALRFEITEAAQILRCSRALLYERIKAGAIRTQKDGFRTYISAIELQRYVRACDRRGNGR